MKWILVSCVVLFVVFVEGLPKKVIQDIEVSTLKIITLKPEVAIAPVEPTKAPTLRFLDDVDQANSPMFKIKSLDMDMPARTRRNRKKTHNKNKDEAASIPAKLEKSPAKKLQN